MAAADWLRIRWRTLALTWLVVGSISVFALRGWQRAGHYLPPLSILLAVLLVGIAAVVAGLGLRLRRWVRRGRPLDPLGATRTLVLGQSAAITGAALAGYLSAVLIVAGMQDAPQPRTLALISIPCLAAATVLSLSGMLTQWCCRVPQAPDSDPDQSSTP
ncbi:MAG: DUF3180 domain-containing protein [Beutenbergiaceae bacterium]